MRSIGKKFLSAALALSLLGLAGCSSLPKKFIRKKKEVAHKPSVVFLEDQGKYQKQFSNDYYYKTHFTLWRSWHDDVLDNLTGNSKKLSRSAEEAYSHLDQMSNYLVADKQAELKALVAELDSYRKKFAGGAYTKSDANSMRSDLDRIRRAVANNFYYDKIKDQLLSDQVDLNA